MDAIQEIRREIQQMSNDTSWNKSISKQSSQLALIQKYYANNGLELKRTCIACPEQYDVFKNGKMVAYYRLRHGIFTVDYPNNFGVRIYSAEPNGDGIFDDDERFMYMSRAKEAVLAKLKDSQQTIEEIIYESCQRFKWWLDGEHTHGISWDAFLKMPTEAIVFYYNVEMSYFRKNG